MELLVLTTLLAAAFATPTPYKDPMFREDLFEGDIYGIDPSTDRNAVVHEQQRWPHGEVPYIVAPELEYMSELIRKAMDYIESVSCVRFRPRSDYDRDYVHIFSDNGCYSHWGRIDGGQGLSLGSGCDNFAIILHELMHTIGFEHEHNRSDRDEYLTIYWENIQENHQYAFTKLRPDQNRLLTQFDFSSIMLYGSRAFAKDNTYSMVRKDGLVLEEIYHKKSMSVLDAQRINMLYSCY